MNSKKLLVIWLCIVSLALFCAPVFAASSAKKAEEVAITVEYAREGKTPWAVVWLSLRADYHAYAHDLVGNTGRPTTLTMAEGRGEALPVFYPAGMLQRDIYAPSVMVRVYEGRVPLFVRMDGLKAGQTVAGRLELLLCSTKHCLPLARTVSLTLPKGEVSALPVVASQPWAEQWYAAVAGKAGGAPKNNASDNTALGKGMPDSAVPAASKGKALTAGGASVSLGSASADAASASSAGLQGGLQSGAAVSLDGTPVAGDDTAPTSNIQQADDSGWTFAPRAVQEETEVSSLGKAVLLGLLAGFLLNCMPCVLPVLTLKASAMLVVGDGDKAARARRFREHNIFFAAGVLTQFFVLAMILGTAGLIWGQIFQSVTFVAAMLVVVFLLGLSMLGLFTLPIIDLKGTSSGSPRLQAFLTGIMATLLATPCSGPLLGGVLSWAFMQPQAVLMVVFMSVGLGMSTPYFVLAARPELAAFLPRPGKWMAVLERLVGFFLLGTSLYLLSILPQEQHMSLLAALLVVALGGWIWGYFGGYDAPPWRRNVLGLGLMALVLSVVMFAAHPPVADTVWEKFDAATFRQELGKEPMLVEFTADWCPNCKFLERTVLTPRRLQHWKEQYNLRFIRVDLTRAHPEAEALLQALGGSSIPLTAIFTKGLSSSAPLVLRDIYSVDMLKGALRRAFP